MQANRNEYFVFIRQIKYKCGLNNVSNHLQSVIKKGWMLVEKNLFKTHCKKSVIQAQLLLLKIACIHCSHLVDVAVIDF